MKLTDRQKKQIIAEYISGGTTTTKLGKKYGVSQQTISKILTDEKVVKSCKEKKEENTLSMLEFMEKQKVTAQQLIEIALKTSVEQMQEASLRDKMGALKILDEVFAKKVDTNNINNDKFNNMTSFSEKIKELENIEYKQEKPF